MALLEQEDYNLCSQRKGGVSCEEYKKTYIIFAVLTIMVAVGAFFIGRASVKKGSQGAGGPSCNAVEFYATIEEIDGRNFRVQGSDVNDINHRGVFDFLLDENATIMEGSLEIPIEELRVGDTVVVTYYGEI